MKLFLSLVLILLSANISSAQFSFNYNDSIPVIRFGDTLSQPWAGGLNYVQLSAFDYDLDGADDLFFFDRSSNNIRVFVQKSGPNGPYYDYVYGADADFPSDLRYRVQLVDFDQDGRKDIFTWGLVGGLRVYRNVSDLTNGLQWVLFKDIVYSDYAVGGVGPLGIIADDLPAIVDVDDDGDIDVLTSDAQGIRLEYHQNQSVEMYGIPDSLIFVQKNECWGKFTEGITNFTITLNDTTPPCVNGNIANPERNIKASTQKSMHQGTTLLCIDIDSSGVKDILMGDAAFSGITLLVNGGTAVNTDSPMTSLDAAFPSYTTPIKCQNFPGSFYVDVDFDGRKDLIVSPNTEVNALDRESVILYRNIGTNAIPTFTPISNNFLQAEMIDHGTGSIPVFFDYNGDGLEDLLVANYYNYKPVGDKESLIALYHNVGTSASPVFEFVDMDVFNLAQENFGLRTVPAFGDVDNDGDKDLMLGLADGSIVFYENLASGTTPIWNNPIFNFEDHLGTPINVNAFAHPQLFDLDNDGLVDLLIGNRVGNIAYYRNNGTAGTPSFELVDNTLGEVDILPGNQNSNAAIHFFRKNNETHLFAGSFDGNLTYYNGIDGNLSPSDTFTLVSASYHGVNVGRHSAVYTVDLNGDGELNLFLGQDLGGLYHYNMPLDLSVSLEEVEQPLLALYPNPTSQSITISAGIPIESVEVRDVHGKLIQKNYFSESEIHMQLEQTTPGIYFARVALNSGICRTKKIVVR